MSVPEEEGFIPETIIVSKALKVHSFKVVKKGLLMGASRAATSRRQMNLQKGRLEWTEIIEIEARKHQVFPAGRTNQTF